MEILWLRNKYLSEQTNQNTSRKLSTSTPFWSTRIFPVVPRSYHWQDDTLQDHTVYSKVPLRNLSHLSSIIIKLTFVLWPMPLFFILNYDLHFFLQQFLWGKTNLLSTDVPPFELPQSSSPIQTKVFYAYNTQYETHSYFPRKEKMQWNVFYHNFDGDMVLSRACSAGGSPLKKLIPVRSSMSRTLAVFCNKYSSEDWCWKTKTKTTRKFRYH